MKWVIILLCVQIKDITSKSIENAVLCNNTINEANNLEIIRVIDENDQIVPYNGNFKVFKIIGDIVNGNNKNGTEHEDTEAGLAKESNGVVLLVNCNNYNDRKHTEVNEFYDLCLNNDFATEPKKLEVKIDGKAEKHLIKLFPIINNATNLITTPLLGKKLGNNNKIRETRKGFDNKAQIFLVHDDLHPSPLHISKINPSYIRTIKSYNKNNANVNNNSIIDVATDEANKIINKEKVEHTADISNIRDVREKLLDHLLDYFINLLKHDTENNNLMNIYQIEEKLKNYYDPQHIETVFNNDELKSNTNDLDNNSQIVDQKYIPDKEISISENHREPAHLIPNQTANEKGYNDSIKNKDVSETKTKRINVSNHILPVTATLETKLGKYSRNDTTIIPIQVHKDEIHVHEYLNKLPIEPEIERQNKINDTNVLKEELLHKLDNFNHEFPIVEINDTAEPHLKLTLNSDKDVHSFPYEDLFEGKFDLKPENIEIYKESNTTNTKPVEDDIDLNNSHLKEESLKLNTNNSIFATNKTIDGNVFYFNHILSNKVLETNFDGNGFVNTKIIGIKNPNITTDDLNLLNDFANMNKNTSDNNAFDHDNVSNEIIDHYLENDVSHKHDATVINQPHKKSFNHRKDNKNDQNLNSASKNKSLTYILTNHKITKIGMGNDSDETGSKKIITTYTGNNISSDNIDIEEEEVNGLTVTVNLLANMYNNNDIYSFLMNIHNHGKALDEINGNTSKFEKHNETMQVCNNKPLVLHFNINIQ